MKTADDWWLRIERAMRRENRQRVERGEAEDVTPCPANLKAAKAARKQLGLKHNRSWYQADHIVARAEGGRDHPDNLRTLCVACHKARTAEQRRRWAEEARAQKASLFSSVEVG
jgi:5-methylcytosine-specific restriction protein A